MSTHNDFIRNYRPNLPADHWSAMSDLVRTVVRDYAVGRSRDAVVLALTHLASFADWAYSIGLAPTRELLRRDVIDAYATHRASEVESFVAGRERKVLLTLAGLPHTVERGGAFTTVSATSAPYSPDETEEIRAWAHGQPSEYACLNAQAIVALGLGAGLACAEMARSMRDDVVRESERLAVAVRGLRARTVNVDTAWSDELIHAVARSGTFLVAPDATRRTGATVTAALQGALGAAPSTFRMRNTWLLARVAEGLTRQELLAVSGLTSIRSLERLVRIYAPDHVGILGKEAR